MTDVYESEIVAFLARSEGSIHAAKALVATGHFDFAASRAYYAAYYAAIAIILREGWDLSNHKRAIAAINQRFVKTGRLEQLYGRELNWLFALRRIGDYGETLHVPREEAEKAIEAAARFLGKIKEILGKN